jgi:hypothetical protein
MPCADDEVSQLELDIRGIRAPTGKTLQNATTTALNLRSATSMLHIFPMEFRIDLSAVDPNMHGSDSDI